MNTTNLNVTLTLDELNFILQVLGDLPTKTGAYPLVIKIKEQAEAQLPNKDDPTTN